MTITYPSVLPQPKIQGYGYQPTDILARTQMESGIARQRQRFTASPTMVTVSWIMNQEQLGLFESWYKYKAKYGAEWFNIDLLNGLEINSNQVRFNKPYKASLIGHRDWNIQATLEVREMRTLSEGSLNLLLNNINLATINNIETKLNEFVNGDLYNKYNW